MTNLPGDVLREPALWQDHGVSVSWLNCELDTSPLRMGVALARVSRCCLQSYYCYCC